MRRTTSTSAAVAGISASRLSAHDLGPEVDVTVVARATAGLEREMAQHALTDLERTVAQLDGALATEANRRHARVREHREEQRPRDLTFDRRGRELVHDRHDIL